MAQQQQRQSSASSPPPFAVRSSMSPTIKQQDLPPNKRQRLSPNPPSHQPELPQQSNLPQDFSPQPVPQQNGVQPNGQPNPLQNGRPQQGSPYQGTPQQSNAQHGPSQNGTQQGTTTQNHSQSGLGQPGLVGPPRPAQPYHQSPYPNTAQPTTNQSPHFPNVQLPQYNYANPKAAYNNSPYGNGGSQTPSLPQSPLAFPGHNLGNQAQYANQMAQQPPGAMGPPLKPAEKPKDDQVDPMDVLGGTGIDLREEEQYQFSYSFNKQQTGSQAGFVNPSHSFTQFPPGDAKSFYGSGPANAKAEETTESQEQYAARAAREAWEKAASDLAVSRRNELNNPFLQISRLHTQLSKFTRESGLNLNTDKANNGMGTFMLPQDYPDKSIKIKTQMGPDGVGLVSTQSNFIPIDSLLVDQIALISIATKQRLRGLISEASKLSQARTSTQHGTVPDEWASAAAPIQAESAAPVTEGALRAGWESAVSPESNTRTVSEATAGIMPTPNSEGGKAHNEQAKFKNSVIETLRQSAVKERDVEEARLRKRLARASGDATRQGSIVPGTPGSVAPESSEKAPSKKEQRKTAAAKTNDAMTHAAANTTTAQFLGGGGSKFGKKKKGYDWMNAGGGGSGASTPRIVTKNLPGTPANSAPERLTSDGVRRLGGYRDRDEQKKGIQLRDWVWILEEDGHEKKALQMAYAKLDNEAGPK